MRQIADTTALRLQAVLSDELIANVGARLHPRQPLLVTAYYGTESRLDLWDTEQGRRIQNLALHGKADEAMTGVLILGADGMPESPVLPIRDLDLSPDGLVVAVACGKGVRLVNVDETAQTLRGVAELSGRQDAVHAVRFSSNGDLLASADDGGRLVIWSVATNQVVSEYRLTDARFRCVDFSQDDLLVACGDSDGNIVVWDVVTGHQLAYFQAHSGEANTLAFGPQGYLLATGGVDGLVRMWDMAESSPFGEPLVHADSVYRVRFDSSGTMLFTCSFDQKVGVWRLDRQELIDAYHDDNAVLSLDLSRSDDKIVLVTSGALKLLKNSRLPLAPSPRSQAPTQFGSTGFAPLASPFVTAVGESLELVQSADGDMLVGDISADYAAARVDTSGARPLPPPPEPLPYTDNPFDGTSDLHSSPFAPGESQVGPFRRADSTPLIPARHQSGVHQLKSDSARQRLASEAAERKQSARYRRALVVAAIIAVVVGIGSMFVNISPDIGDLADPPRAEAKASLAKEDARHNAEMRRLQTRLDKLSQGTGDRNVAPLKREIQRGIEAEKQRHTAAVSAINSSATDAVSKLEADNRGPHPAFQALVSAVLTFAMLIVLFWVALRFVFRTGVNAQPPSTNRTGL